MAQQLWDGAKVGSRIVPVCGKAVAEGVRVEGFANTGALGGVAAGVPDHFIAEGIV